MSEKIGNKPKPEGGESLLGENKRGSLGKGNDPDSRQVEKSAVGIPAIRREGESGSVDWKSRLKQGEL